MRHAAPSPAPRRRRGDALIRGLIVVAVVAILGGVYVARERPTPAYPRAKAPPRGAR